MEKRSRILVTGIFLIYLSVSVLFTYGQPTTTLGLPNLGDGIAPGTVNTQITLDAIGGGGNFGTFQIFILYDTLVLTPTNITYPNPNLPFYEFVNNLKYSPNEIIITWLSHSAGYTPSVGETLCNIEWTYAGNSTYSDIIFDDGINIIPTGSMKVYTMVWTTIGEAYSVDFNHGSIGPPNAQ